MMAVPVMWAVTTGGRFVLVHVVKRKGKQRAKAWTAKQAKKGYKLLPSGPISWPKFPYKRRGSARTQNNKSAGKPMTRKTMRGPSATNRKVRSKRSPNRRAGKTKRYAGRSVRPPYCWRHKRYHWCPHTR